VKGYERSTGFDITAASEIMAILALSTSMADMQANFPVNSPINSPVDSPFNSPTGANGAHSCGK
jgi:hypothetical protein